MNDQRTIAAIAWDLDNTLFNRDDSFRLFFRSWLSEIRPELEAPAVESLLGWIATLDRSGTGDRLEFCAKVLNAARAGEIPPGTLWETIQNRLPGFITPDPAIVALLERISSEFEMILVTNGGSTFQRAKATACGLDRFFPGNRIVVSSEVGAAKPSSFIFHEVLRRLNFPPDRVLFVGDHVMNDIEGPAAMGMRTCWISNGRPKPAGLPADLVLTYAHELRISMISTLSLDAAA